MPVTLLSTVTPPIEGKGLQREKKLQFHKDKQRQHHYMNNYNKFLEGSRWKRVPDGSYNLSKAKGDASKEGRKILHHPSARETQDLWATGTQREKISQASKK